MPVLKTRIHELRKERKMQQSDLAEPSVSEEKPSAI